MGFGDRMLYGEVEKVNQYSEPTGWRQANVKDYKAFVAIENPPPDLRTGMTAAVTIKCAEVSDALQVPVQAVYAHGDKFYCFVYDKGVWEARKIKPGPTNDKFFVIESGLNVGDQVAMNPRGYVADVKLPKLSPEEAQRAVPQPRGPRPGEQTADTKGGERKAEGGGAEATKGGEPANAEQTGAEAKPETTSGPQPSALSPPPAPRPQQGAAE